MGIKITISNAPGKRIFAGDIVEGTVEVKVDAKDKQGSPAEKLTLKLEGHIETLSVYNRYWSKYDFQARSKRALISKTIELTTFAGKAPHGTHVFPFSFSLPPDMPGSMKENKSSMSWPECEVSYSIQAHLSCPGLLNLDVKSSLPLKVLAQRQNLFAPQYMGGPETRPVKTCCCLDSGGSTSFAFLVDSQAVGRAGDVGVTMVARNDSSFTFESLTLEIHQQTRWLAEGYPGFAQRKVASGEFKDDDFCVWKKMDGARRASKVAEDASGDLKQTLATGGGTRYALTIPDTCADTVSMPNIVVTHNLVVKLETSSCSEGPSLTIPLLVYQGASVGEGHSEGVPLVRVLSQSPEHRPQITDSTAHNTPQPQQPFPVQQQPTGSRVQPMEEDQMQHAPQNAVLPQGYPIQQQPTGSEEQAVARSEVTVTGSPPVGAPSGGIWHVKDFRGQYTCKFALFGTAVSVLFPTFLGPSAVLIAPAGILLAFLCPCDERMVYAHGGVNFKEDGQEEGWFC